MTNLIFIFRGPYVPKYVISSIQLATKNSGLDVTIMSDKFLRKYFSGLNVHFVDIGDFYNPEKFNSAKNNVTLDHNFREGFWLHTLERFFILEQFMDYQSLNRIFHAELDQLLFGIDNLIYHLDRLSHRGVFFPFHSPTKAVASVLYCNELSSLKKITESAVSGLPFPNEMELLVRWTSEFPESSIALPTLYDTLIDSETIKDKRNNQVLSQSEIEGVVDAAEIGLWVGGRDPRNLALNIKPATKFTYPPDRASIPKEVMKTLNFMFYPEQKLLTVQENSHGKSYRLYNLHIQSKIHPWLLDEKNLTSLINNANTDNPFTVPGTRVIQLNYAFRIILSRIRQEGIRYILLKIIEVFKFVYKKYLKK